MRTNGFIFIALGLTAAAWADTPGYLPSVGPVALRFDSDGAAKPVATLPVPVVISEATEGPAAHLDVVADIPVGTPSNGAPNPTALMHDLPVVLPEALTGASTNLNQALIGPMMETNNVITPQMFLRFFTPAQGGAAREAIVIPPTDFNPARPPTPSSTATYTQPKP